MNICLKHKKKLQYPQHSSPPKKKPGIITQKNETSVDYSTNVVEQCSDIYNNIERQSRFILLLLFILCHTVGLLLLPIVSGGLVRWLRWAVGRKRLVSVSGRLAS